MRIFLQLDPPLKTLILFQKFSRTALDGTLAARYNWLENVAGVLVPQKITQETKNG